MDVSIAPRAVVMEPSALFAVSFIRGDEHRWFGVSRKSNATTSGTTRRPTSMLVLIYFEAAGWLCEFVMPFFSTQIVYESLGELPDQELG